MAYVEDDVLDSSGLADIVGGITLLVRVRFSQPRNAILRDGEGYTSILLTADQPGLNAALRTMIASVLHVGNDQVSIIEGQGKLTKLLRIEGINAGQAVGSLLSRAVQDEEAAA